MKMQLRCHHLTAIVLLAAASANATIDGSFIQLHRGKVERTVEDWRADLHTLRNLQADTVIIQWSAEEPVIYFEAQEAPSSRFTETYPAIERILEAAEAEGMSVLIGLQHHPEYWDQIKGREKVIRDFFRLRMARNERLQRALLQTFGNRRAWTGYYIPDEVDDLTWRDPAMQAIIHDYLKRMAAILRRNDAGRTIAVSSFFRGRTSPERMTENLMAMLGDTGIDILLVQDGVGTGDPPLQYVPLYYNVLSNAWKTKVNDEERHTQLPALWCVIETFRQTSGLNDPFTAEPASPERVQEQIDAARPHFEKLVTFTFDDYREAFPPPSTPPPSDP